MLTKMASLIIRISQQIPSHIEEGSLLAGGWLGDQRWGLITLGDQRWGLITLDTTSKARILINWPGWEAAASFPNVFISTCTQTLME